MIDEKVLHTLAEASLTASLAVKSYWDWKRGIKRDKVHRKEVTDAVSRAVQDMAVSMNARLDGISKEIDKLFAHIIGPDGRNGIRGDLNDLREEVRGILERERTRLLHGDYDRRNTGGGL